jgi:hypothetical protein
MDDFKDKLIFRVDFSNVAPDGRMVKAALPHASSPRVPEEGEYVFLMDAEGNRCHGWIKRVQGLIAFVELDEASWISGDLVTQGLPEFALTGA